MTQRQGHRSGQRHRAPLLAGLALGLLALAGCFEEPVTQSMLLQFLPSHTVKVSVRVRIQEPDPASERLKRRLAETRRELLAGDDAWSRRFSALAPAAERRTWEKTLGEVAGVTHQALLDDPEALGRFFEDTALEVSWREPEGERAELEIRAFPPAGATAHERAAVDRALTDWPAALARYFAALARLYDSLEDHPERATACLGGVLRDDLDEATATALAELTAEEETLVDGVRDAMKDVAGVLVVAETEASSLDEMSHRVYDPFPAKLTVRVPGPILEVEGFTRAATGDTAGATLHARGIGLWDALASLRNRWAEPNLLMVHVAQQRAGEGTLDLARLATAARRAESPGAREIRAALLERLRAEPLYRVAWSTAGLADPPAQSLREAWGEDD